jgi:spermidine synthase
VGLAGLMGMITEIALILGYQTSSGILYQDLGLLLTLFMAGLTLGALAIDLAASAGAGGRALGRGAGAVMLVAFGLLNWVVSRVLTRGSLQGLALTGILLLLTGFLVAAVFAFVSLHRRPDQRLVLSRLYAADLLGGCLGSVGATLLLIPAVGPAGAAWSVVLLALGALLLV